MLLEVFGACTRESTGGLAIKSAHYNFIAASVKRLLVPGDGARVHGHSALVAHHLPFTMQLIRYHS